MVNVSYSAHVSIPVPYGIDLEDKTVVKNWWVIWNKLYIFLADGRELEIDGEDPEPDYKRPDDTEVSEDNAPDEDIEAAEVIQRVWRRVARRNKAALKIQLKFKEAISNPSYKLCRRRLMREYAALNE